MKIVRSLLLSMLMSFAFIVPAAFAGEPPAPAPQQSATLYQRLGGYDALAAVTDDFLGQLATDPQLGRFFIGLSTDSKVKVRQHVVDFLCAATGGPSPAAGRGASGRSATSAAGTRPPARSSALAALFAPR